MSEGIPVVSSGVDVTVNTLESLLARLQSGEGLAEDAVVQAAKGGIGAASGVALGVVDVADKTVDQIGGEVFAALNHALEAARALGGSKPSA